MINADTREAWQALATKCGERRPYVGRTMCVAAGRKHRGTIGVVQKHMVSRFKDPFRYASDAQATLRELAGRAGYVVLLAPCDGSTPFWVNAEHVEPA